MSLDAKQRFAVLYGAVPFRHAATLFSVYDELVLEGGSFARELDELPSCWDEAVRLRSRLRRRNGRSVDDQQLARLDLPPIVDELERTRDEPCRSWIFAWPGAGSWVVFDRPRSRTVAGCLWRPEPPL